MKVRIVMRSDLAAGFALAGVDVTRAADAAAAADAVARALADGSVAILLVDEGLYDSIPRDVRTHWDRQAAALVVPVPAPVWDRPSGADAYILDILRQAIGYRVRPR